MLPRPTPQLVRDEGDEFDSDPSTRLAEDAVAQLWTQFPCNAEVPHVYLKVLVLNKLYNAGVRDIDVEALAKHIAGLSIDALLAAGSPRAFDLILNCGHLRKYFSFASKYCSWHNLRAYPIYDRNVDECLWTYRNQDHFASFQRKDFDQYEKFVTLVAAFRSFYGLEAFTFKELDKFLWRTGDQILRKVGR